MPEGNIDHENIVSNLFEIEWPPKSGKKASFPEIDSAGWFDMETAGVKIIPGQAGLLTQLLEYV
jgi:predicted NUDIX family NTP pyrophosphohydrolase